MKEFRDVLKSIRKTTTKRDHKVWGFFFLVQSGHVLNVLVQLTDYDRFNNTLTKFHSSKEKTLSDEKNLFKVREFACT